MRERGTAPIELALGIGLLVVPVAVAVLAFVPALDRRSDAFALAEDLARLVAIGRPWGEIIEGAAPDLGGVVGVGMCTVGMPAPGFVSGSCEPEAGGVVRVTVVVPGPAIITPLGTVAADPIVVTVVEPVDRHRSLP